MQHKQLTANSVVPLAIRYIEDVEAEPKAKVPDVGQTVDIDTARAHMLVDPKVRYNAVSTGYGRNTALGAYQGVDGKIKINSLFGLLYSTVFTNESSGFLFTRTAEGTHHAHRQR